MLLLTEAKQRGRGEGEGHPCALCPSILQGFSRLSNTCVRRGILHSTAGRPSIAIRQNTAPTTYCSRFPFSPATEPLSRKPMKKLRAAACVLAAPSLPPPRRSASCCLTTPSLDLCLYGFGGEGGDLIDGLGEMRKPFEKNAGINGTFEKNTGINGIGLQQQKCNSRSLRSRLCPLGACVESPKARCKGAGIHGKEAMQQMPWSKHRFIDRSN